MMGRRGRKRRLEIESEYWRLISSGVGTVEACKMLGIGRKTGYRWRAENGGLPPAVLAEQIRSDRYLSLLERQRIATLRRDGLGVREIAVELARSPSTISRELRRNKAPHDRSYDGDLAHSRARERLRRPRRGRLLVDGELRGHVEAKLEQEWSPEQIANWLRVMFPDRTDWHVCHETIYQALYLGGRGGLRRQLTRRLRTSRPLRKRRRQAAERRTRFVVPGRLIDQRPQIVLKRERIGDWEGDLIVGRQNRSAIATLVDRHSRYVHLVHLPSGHDATEVRDALIAVFAEMPGAARHTLTWDQGSELAHHQDIGEHLQQGVYFAYPASPWLRGTNENTNGLLRQYFPKGTNLSLHGIDELTRVQDRLNNRPRKTLGWRTPAEVFYEQLRS